MVKLIGVTSSAQKVYVAEVGFVLTLVGVPPKPLNIGGALGTLLIVSIAMSTSGY